jgi:CheY-like chemotaxis protein
VSGYGHEQDVRQSLAAGFSNHLVKPIDLPRLLEAIDAAVVAAGACALRTDIRGDD